MSSPADPALEGELSPCDRSNGSCPRGGRRLGVGVSQVLRGRQRREEGRRRRGCQALGVSWTREKEKKRTQWPGTESLEWL